MDHFKDANLPQPLFHRLEQMGFTEPTPIQAKSIPFALQGRDVLGTAQTGTGKTGAYGIPLVAQLLESPRGTGLILLPTRELAQQVMVELGKFIGNSKIKSALLIGGEPMPKQVRQLQMNPRLIVGTPGRINDHLDRGNLMLHNVNYLVLDEVDRMLDMGFGVQLDAIARFLTAKRQTLMFSATLPDAIKKVSDKYLSNPERVSVGSTTAIATKVKQEEVRLTTEEKYPRLLEELEKRQGSVIIFVKTKRNADRLSVKLRKEGHKTDALHGDLRQNARNRVVKNYRESKFRILVATDVAARGLDIPHIEHVINFDLPQCPEDYIHRIGRTGRAGAEGNAICFITGADRLLWNGIQRLINPDAKLEPAPKGSKPKKRSGSRPGGRPHGKGPGGGKPGGRSGKSAGHRKGGSGQKRSGGDTPKSNNPRRNNRPTSKAA